MMPECHKKIQNVNIRTTAIEAFWGDDFSESIYLWPGSAHTLSLNQIRKNSTPILDDCFYDKNNFKEAYQNCKTLHEKILIQLTEKLNEIHNLQLPSSYYKTAFGYWLYRHICITYDKFIALNLVDGSKISIKLLSKDSFFIPYNHYDYFSCFTSDFGVQQLTSIYFYMRKYAQFPQICEHFALNYEVELNATESKQGNKLWLRNIKKLLKNALYNNEVNNIDVALIEIYFTEKNKQELFSKSNGKIRDIELPKLNCQIKPVDFLTRNKFLEIKCDTDFEKYFYNTLIYCFPKMYLEYFKEYFLLCQNDVNEKNFKYLVSEGWISHIPASIYAATSRLLGKKFICYEHAANTILYDYNIFWIDSSASDIFLTVGWHLENSNIQQGGFAIKNVVPYKFEESKKKILFIDFVRPPFLIEFSGNNLANNSYLKQLELAYNFITAFPEIFREHFVFRPRNADYFWNTEKALELNKKNIKVDKDVYSESIQKARIIIINHMSSGLAEIVLNDIPFLIFIDPDIEMINTKYNLVFEKFLNCKILHYSQKSVFDHLAVTYDDIESWWKSSLVKDAIEHYKREVLNDSSKTIDYLLSLVNQPVS